MIKILQSKKSNEYWEVVEYSNQGKRRSLEDATIIEDAIAGDSIVASLLVGVLDGHSGDRCARYLATQLPVEIKKHSKFLTDPAVALRDAFLDLDQKWLETQVKGNMFEDGSTALCCLIQNDTLFVANTGDCRAIMCFGGETKVLSRDHKADDKEEQERITQLGGFVVGGRLQGKLEVSRSFGDYKYKENDQKYLTAEPEIKDYQLTPDVDFIVIGCDGLYEEWNNDDLIDFVKRSLDQKLPTQSVIESLVKEAIDRGCKDNVTGIIIKFEKGFKKMLQNGRFPIKKSSKSERRKSANDSSSSLLIKKKVSPTPPPEKSKKEEKKLKFQEPPENSPGKTRNLFRKVLPESLSGKGNEETDGSLARKYLSKSSSSIPEKDIDKKSDES